MKSPKSATGDKVAGVLAPVFSIRDNEKAELGIGDTQSLKGLIDWAAECGLKLVKLLPVNETGVDNSPYNALSSRALDPITLRMTPKDIPGLTREHLEHARRQHPAKEGDDPAKVDYMRVKALKTQLLNLAFQSLCSNAAGSSMMKRLHGFISEQGTWLREYAIFRTLLESHINAPWSSWPAEHQSMNAFHTWYAGLPKVEQRAISDRILFYSYVQWVAFRQWHSVKRHAQKRGVSLMGDIPFGVSPCSADVWANRHLFLQNWYGGAPPEEFFKHDAFVQKWGQNWGIPVYDWEAHRKEGFSWWRQRVAGVREFFHQFRIDHILGFFRVYAFPWPPTRNAEFLPLTHDQAKILTGGLLPRFHPYPDDDEAHRSFNSKSGTAILEAILEETDSSSVVGEDLGLVPEYVPRCLKQLGIAGYKVPQWQTLSDGSLCDGAEYDPLSLATYGTHDHEPLRVLWEGLVERAQNDLNAAGALQALANFAGIPPQKERLYSPAVHEALLRALLSVNSRMVVFTITDIFSRTERFNLPGIAGEQNWTQRLHAPISVLRKSRESLGLTALVRELRGAGIEPFASETVNGVGDPSESAGARGHPIRAVA